jgi:hypothetical protein
MAAIGERRSAVLESVLLSPGISIREARTPRTGAVSDSGSGTGAEASRQVRSDALYEADRQALTCADTCRQTARSLERPVRDQACRIRADLAVFRRSWPGGCQFDVP